MIHTQYSNEVLAALATLRRADLPLEVSRALDTLDNAGVFADLDEQSGYASAEDILAETYRAGLKAMFPNAADPAEWGDTTTADMAEHQTGRHRRVPVDEPLIGAEAERIRIALRQNEV